MANTSRAVIRTAIHKRIRRKVRGSTERPRLAVYRSLNHIYAQVIDDVAGCTIASASTTEKLFKSDKAVGANRVTAEKVGKLVAERSRSKSILKVVFDRGGFLYSGKVKALAEAARAGGLEF